MPASGRPPPGFAGIGFPIGTPASVRRVGGDEAGSLQSRLAGWVEGACILLTPPSRAGVASATADGETLHVRLAHGPWLCTFAAPSLGAAAGPAPILALGWPAAFAITRVRAAARRPAGIVATLAHEGALPRHACVVRDMGPGGLLVEARHCLAQAGHRVRVRLRVEAEGARHLLDLPGTVRNVSPVMAAGLARAWRHGIELEPLAAPARRLLEAHLATPPPGGP